MWTRRDDKLLELLLIRHFPRWDIIAYNLAGNKTPEQACRRYESLLDEVTRVLQGLEVDTPREWDAQQIVVAASPAPEREAAVAPAVATVADVVTVASLSAGEEAAAAPVAEEKKDLVPTPSSAADSEASGDAEKKTKRKKPEKWTKEEHYLFLEGLEKYGKGKWKEMASEFLTTKTSTQIASHHQKYSKRLEQRMRDGCKRTSIHDITAPPPTARGGGEPAAAQNDQELGSGSDESKGSYELVGASEEFPGFDYLATLFT